MESFFINAGAWLHNFRKTKMKFKRNADNWMDLVGQY